MALDDGVTIVRAFPLEAIPFKSSKGGTLFKSSNGQRRKPLTDRRVIAHLQ